MVNLNLYQKFDSFYFIFFLLSVCSGVYPNWDLVQFLVYDYKIVFGSWDEYAACLIRQRKTENNENLRLNWERVSESMFLHNVSREINCQFIFFFWCWYCLIWENVDVVQEQAKSSEFKGFTGRPIYSVWCGSESEQRAIFVDEIKCVGCLKCALLAEKTFAVESVYGRARVVSQWADSPNKIDEAIESCPVNCIS